MKSDRFPLPADLPAPADDGACDHLIGRRFPSRPLPSSDGGSVDLGREQHTLVVYAYPATGVPGRALPDGWDAMPGARGCTPQACGYRDRHAEFRALRVGIFGLSAQSNEEQAEAARRLALPYPLLCDATFESADALGLPTFVLGGKRYLKRATLVVEAGIVAHVRYPVFPPDEDASELLGWISARAPPSIDVEPYLH